MAFFGDFLKGLSASSEKLPGAMANRYQNQVQQEQRQNTAAEVQLKKNQAFLSASIETVDAEMANIQKTIQGYLSEGKKEAVAPYLQQYNELKTRRQGLNQRYLDLLRTGTTQARLFPGMMKDVATAQPTATQTPTTATQAPPAAPQGATGGMATPELGEFGPDYLKSARERQKAELTALGQQSMIAERAWDSAKEHADTTGDVEGAIQRYIEINPLSTASQREITFELLKRRAKPMWDTEADLDNLARQVARAPQTIEFIPMRDRLAVGKRMAKLGLLYEEKLPPNVIESLTEGDMVLYELGHLSGLVEENKDFFGPLAGRLAPLFIGTDLAVNHAKVVAELDRVKQIVSKYLEGGVLRESDEKKYMKILANIKDYPEVAIYKIRSILKSLKYKRERKLYYYKNAGYKTPVQITEGDYEKYKLNLPVDVDTASFDDMMDLSEAYPELIPYVKAKYPDKLREFLEKEKAKKAKKGKK